MRALAQPFDEVVGKHGHLVIEGAAGLGKTTLGYQVAHELARALLDPTGTPPVERLAVPLVLPARVLAMHLHRGWNEALPAAVANEYDTLGDGLPIPALFTTTVHDLPWLVIVDALDEIPDQASREKLLTALAARMSDPDSPARFLVTTRPLAPGEVQLLAGPQVGFYELQPFDAAALNTFAYRWFDPDNSLAGKAAAREFLDQIEAAGLGDILEVPLLAALAAQVHAARLDQPLPGSRYELYEQYIDHLGAIRAIARSAALESFRLVAGGTAFADWLEAHRVELLERLATTYTTADTRLLDDTEKYLVAQAPLPERLPAGWTESMAEWLSLSGLLSRQGGRLRFLHQTFAEHLAASATARALPDDVRPELPPWDDLIRRLLLEDESGTRVVLHYLHRQGPGASLLTMLLTGGRDYQDRGAELVIQGAPADSAQLATFLSQLEERVLVGLWGAWRLRQMAGLTRHSAVRNQLRQLSANPQVQPAMTITIFGLLRKSCPDLHDRAIDALNRWISDDQSIALRCASAGCLARFGGSHGIRAAAALRTLTSDHTYPITERVRAARELAELGVHDRADAADALATMAAEEGGDEYDRAFAMRELAGLGGEHRDRGAVIAQELAQSPATTGYIQVQAASTLAELGGEYRQRAADILRIIASDPTVDRRYQTEALAAAAAIIPDLRDAAATALRDLTADITTSIYQRLEAARKLADLGPQRRDQAAQALLALVVAPIGRENDIDWYWKELAARDLTEINEEHRRQILPALQQIVEGPGPYSTRKDDILHILARLSDEDPALVAKTMYRIFTDPTRAVDERRIAAESQAKISAEHRREVLEFFASVLRDATAASGEHLLASAVLAVLEPSARPLVGALVSRIAASLTAAPSTRLDAAHTLTDLGPQYSEIAMQLICEVAAHPLLSDADRVTAAAAMPDRGDGHRSKAAVLYDLAVDTTIAVDQRSRAAARLAELGGDHRRSGAAVLYSLATDRTIDVDDRHQAARALTRLGGEDQRRGAAVLYNLAVDGMISADHQRRAADSLAELGREDQHRAADALYSLAIDGTVNAGDRRQAASSLAELRSEDRRRGAAVLRDLAGDPAMAAATRRRAAESLIRLRGDDLRRGAGVLHDLTASPLVRLRTRLLSAEALANLGPNDAQQAKELLDLLAVEPAIGAEDRTFVAATAASLNAQPARAAELLSALALDPAADEDARLEASGRIQRLRGADQHHRAADVFAQLATDPSLGVGNQQAAAETLARYGAEHWESAIRVLSQLAVDPDNDAHERLVAARGIARLGSPGQIAARGVLRQITTSRVLDAPVRRWAARSLAELGPSALTESIAALYALCTETTTDMWNRLWAAETLTELGTSGRQASMRALKSLTSDTIDDRLVRAYCEGIHADLDDHHHHRVVDLLIETASDKFEDGWRRVCAASELFAVSRHHEDRSAQLLSAIAADGSLRAWERRQAADRLATLGAKTRVDAADLLLLVTGDVLADPWERAEAATALLELNQHRPQAVAILERLATDTGISGGQRLSAARPLATLASDQAVVALEAICLDSDADAQTRLDSARCLAKGGQEFRRKALEYLRQQATDEASTPLERALARKELHKNRGNDPRDAIDMLLHLADDTTQRPSDRRQAARLLPDFGREFRAPARRVLRELLQRCSNGGFDQAMTCYEAARFGALHRTIAINALVSLHAARLADPARRREIAEALAAIAPAHHFAALHTLRLDVIDSSHDADTRNKAAESLSKITKHPGRIKDLTPTGDEMII